MTLCAGCNRCSCTFYTHKMQAYDCDRVKGWEIQLVCQSTITSSCSSNANDWSQEIREREQDNRLSHRNSHVPAVLRVQTIEKTEERKCNANQCFQYLPTQQQLLLSLSIVKSLLSLQTEWELLVRIGSQWRKMLCFGQQQWKFVSAFATLECCVSWGFGLAQWGLTLHRERAAGGSLICKLTPRSKRGSILPLNLTSRSLAALQPYCLQSFSSQAGESG